MKKIPGYNWYTIRQYDNGEGFDYQHNTNPNQTTMFVTLNKVKDITKPFYLFTHDFKHCSDAIILTQVE